MSTLSRTRATAVGATAVLMWGVLALFTTLTGDVPPFLLTAIAFSIGGLLMICKWIIRGDDIISHLRQPVGAWVLGVVGLFGYHFLYFLALKSAPPVQAGLIAYLWPLLIVVFSALLPGEKLRWFHVIGAISGLVGTVVLVSGSASLELNRSEYFRLLPRLGLRVYLVRVFGFEPQVWNCSHRYGGCVLYCGGGTFIHCAFGI